MITANTLASGEREPVLRCTDRDHAMSWLLATLFCLTLLSSGLIAFWLSGAIEQARYTMGSGGIADIEFLEGAPLPPQALAVSPPDDLTDDPSFEAQPSVVAELVEILEQVGDADVELVNEPPGAKHGGRGDAKNGDDAVIKRPSDEGRPQRWFFNIDRIATIDDYSRLLDQLGIELGAFDEEGFAYLTDVTTAKPQLRRPTTSRDDRFYTVWQSGTLRQLDQRLFQAAGVKQLRSNQILHFFSAKLESQLAALELKATATARRKLKHVRRTWFTATETAGRFTFTVAKQSFRD